MTVQALEALRASRTSGFSKVIGSVSDFDLGLLCEFGDLRSRRGVPPSRGHKGSMESSIDWSCLYKGENNSLVYTYVFKYWYVTLCNCLYHVQFFGCVQRSSMPWWVSCTLLWALDWIPWHKKQRHSQSYNVDQTSFGSNEGDNARHLSRFIGKESSSSSPSSMLPKSLGCQCVMNAWSMHDQASHENEEFAGAPPFHPSCDAWRIPARSWTGKAIGQATRLAPFQLTTDMNWLQLPFGVL